MLKTPTNRDQIGAYIIKLQGHNDRNASWYTSGGQFENLKMALQQIILYLAGRLMRVNKGA